MKRGTTSPAALEPDTTRRRRQPQISCNFCRSKKLKCDRAQPCFNCRSRGLVCDGQPAIASSSSSSSPRDDTDVLERLRRLETAVFGPTTSSSPHHHDSAARPYGSRLGETPATAELDYNKPVELPVLDDSINFSFHVARSGESSGSSHSRNRCIDLPSHDDAASLFHDYLNASYFLIASILYPPSFHTTMSGLYTQLRHDQYVDTGSAALILAVCASAAFFWDQDLPVMCNFRSEDHAAAQSHIWRTAACDLLDQSQRCAANTLESIQARIILADLFYNMEGTTSRFRYFHSCARAAAYEMRLHLVDLPGVDSTDGLFLREMKRRIWWYLVGTDWLSCSMGGVMDRIYAINPKHMHVNRPHYIPAPDELTNGLWSEPAVLHLTLRIRLADICRETADALPLGSDLVTVPYSKIAALDRLFHDLLVDMPALEAPVPMANHLSKRLATQRAIGILSVHARRARLLRPLLQVKDLAPRFQVFRRTCYQSVEAAIDISSRLLSANLNSLPSPPELATAANRSPLIINHLFMACTVIATDPSSLRGDGDEGPELDAEIEKRRAQLENACRLLQKAGEKSAMALDMVKRLVSVLRKHRIQGMEELAPAATIIPRTILEQPVQRQRALPINAGHTADTCSQGLTGGVQQQQEGAAAPTWGPDTMDPSELTGIWDDFLATNSTNDGWGQLFADLDYFSYSL